MSSLLLSRACNAPVRVPVLNQIPLKRILKNYSSEIPTDVLSTRISSLRFLVEQAMESLTYKGVFIYK